MSAVRLPSEQHTAERRLPPGPPLLIEPATHPLRYWVGRVAEVVAAIVFVLLVLALVTP